MLFEKTPLGDFADVQGGYAYKSKDLQLEGFCPVVKIKNVRDGFLSLNDVTYVDEDLTSQTTRFLCETGDVLISMTGSGPNAPDSMVGRVARVKESDLPALINQRVGKLVIREKGSISSKFLYYCLSSKLARNYLVSSSTGSANQANINADTIKSLQIPKISYSESVKIGEFLSKFDDKIELNQKMNQTLEEIAKSIFKSWFVDFDPVRAKAGGRPTGLPAEISDLFPHELVDSEIGEIPKGWKITALSECDVEIESGRRPKGGIDNSLSHGIPSVGAESIAPAGEFDFSKVRYVTADFATKMKKGRVQNFDVAIYKDGAGLESTTPKVAIWGEHFPFGDFFVNEHIFLLRSQVLGQPFLYHLVSSGDFWMQLSAKGTAKSAQPGLNQTEVIESTFTRPREMLVTAFNTAIQSLLERQFLLGKENKVLSELRDTLLPKLISGELRIPDAEKFLEEAGL